LGEYEVALGKIKHLLDQGYINDEEAYLFSAVFFDLGRPEFILPHVRYSPRKGRVYAMMGDKEKAQAYFCRIEHLMRDTYVLKKMGSDKFESFLPLLTAYFDDKDPEDLLTQQEHIALMGLHSLQGDYDKAIVIMDAAMERGFLFIGSFKAPFLEDLSTHPGVAQRIHKMEKSAYALVNAYH